MASEAEKVAQELSKKVEDLQGRVQTQMLPVEKKVAQCVLDCYNQRGGDYNSIHGCVEGCQQTLHQTAKKVKGEMDSLQSSVQACQQAVIKRLEPRAQDARQDPEAQKAIQHDFEQGMVQCVKETEPLLPGIEERIIGYLKQHR